MAAIRIRRERAIMLKFPAEPARAGGDSTLARRASTIAIQRRTKLVVKLAHNR
ncbi:hypothetical protein NK718_02775 [Alsobacter sp. SYSU M60028]|uniref:Uncharacterized protein n=1 Tax=Alsobacter ponti TaxID=2962936 RepID=A0ABT1L7G8_9HYPH|nr:hypothetical protein [Alsobacter ponti]MCP8937427.1 hypothetical protein [Alsobacter ponti]